MISFEVKLPKAGTIPDELEVHLDRDGLQSLLSQLEFLRDGRTDHVHLMSESWGGTHLEDGPSTADGTVIRHVKILMR